MFDLKNKIALLIIVGVVIFGAIVYYSRLQTALAESRGQQELLKSGNTKLRKLIELQKADNLQKQSEVVQLTKEVDVAKATASKALAELAAMKNPVEQGPIDGVADIIGAFKTHYGDSTVEFANNKFAIAHPTTSLVVTDGVNWKLNAPIYKATIEKSNSAIEALKNETNTKDGLIGKYKDANLGLQETIDLKDELINNEQQQGKALSAELSATKKRGRLEIAATALATFLATWAITK